MVELSSVTSHPSVVLFQSLFTNHVLCYYPCLHTQLLLLRPFPIQLCSQPLHILLFVMYRCQRMASRCNVPCTAPQCKPNTEFTIQLRGTRFVSQAQFVLDYIASHTRDLCSTIFHARCSHDVHSTTGSLSSPSNIPLKTSKSLPPFKPLLARHAMVLR